MLPNAVVQLQAPITTAAKPHPKSACLVQRLLASIARRSLIVVSVGLTGNLSGWWGLVDDESGGDHHVAAEAFFPSGTLFKRWSYSSHKCERCTDKLVQINFVATS